MRQMPSGHLKAQLKSHVPDAQPNTTSGSVGSNKMVPIQRRN